MDESQNFRALLRTDLRAAMRERKSAEIGVLRELLAAVDNAQAVAADGRHDTYVFHAFGDSAVEVPRRMLGRAELRRVVETEIGARNDAADAYRRVGRDDEAEELSRGARILCRYLDGLV